MYSGYIYIMRAYFHTRAGVPAVRACHSMIATESNIGFRLSAEHKQVLGTSL